MKKILAAFLICIMIVPCAAGWADYEAVPDTPYGIPLFESVEDIGVEELGAIIEGHEVKNLLEHAGSFEIIEDVIHTIPYSANETRTKAYFLDDGKFVGNTNSFNSDPSMNYSTFTSFKAYDGSDPVNVISTAWSGVTKRDTTPEKVSLQATRTALSFINPEYYGVVNLSGTVENGHYLLRFDLELTSEEDPDLDYKEAFLEIDPETSLILSYGYHCTSEGGREAKVVGTDQTATTSPMDYVATGEIHYGLDRGPDYSLIDQ